MENQNTNPTPEKKTLPTWAIVVITLLVVFIVLPVSCTACGVGCVGCAACAAASTEDTDTQNVIDTVSGSDSANTTALSDAGNLGSYYVEIQSARIGKDYEGSPVIFVTYSFTNNSEEAQSFMFAISDIAYQDGIQLETAIVIDDDQYDSGASLLEIKTGATLTVECAYVLRNTTSPVEIEVTELLSFSNEKLTKTFEIAE